MKAEIERLKAELHEYRSSGGITGVVAAVTRREFQLATGVVAGFSGLARHGSRRR
jgi:hypothetical protein